MASDVEIERVLAVVHATLNDRKVEGFDSKRVQQLITDALGGEAKLSVDDGGGLHDASGARIGALRKTDGGEWIVERQNDSAARSEAAIPKPGPQSKLRKVLTKLRVRG